MTDSATQPASPPVKSYHGIEIIPTGRGFDPKRSFFLLGSQKHRKIFVRRGNRGLLYRGKYSAVIGLKETIAWTFILGTYKKKCFSTNHGAVFSTVHQTTEYRQTTV